MTDGRPARCADPMDYFVSVANGPNRTFIIDTGFTAEEGAKRKRTFLRRPIDSLKLIGIDPDYVEDDWPHAFVGNFHRLAKAQFAGSNVFVPESSGERFQVKRSTRIQWRA